jgi:hypothetical protein
MDWREILRKTPEVTTGWDCRWYWLVVYICVWLIALGLTVIPGTAGVVAVSVAATTLFITTANRQNNESCDS